MVDVRARVGGPALRKLTFHERALHAQGDGAVSHGAEGRVLPRLGGDRRDEGAIRGSTSRAASGRSSRTRAAAGASCPTRRSTSTAPTEALSKGGTFVGRHICVPLEGVAVHINAFNFPVWGMLEKLAPTFLAGMPAIVKPATVTSYLTEAVFRAMIESGILPEGALQLHLRQRRRPARPPRLPGRRRVHRLGGDRHRCSRRRKAIVENNVRFNHGSGLAQLLDARPRRDAGHARSSTSSSRKS